MRVSTREREPDVQIGSSDLRLNLHTIDLNYHVSFRNRQGLYKNMKGRVFDVAAAR